MEIASEEQMIDVVEISGMESQSNDFGRRTFWKKNQTFTCSNCLRRYRAMDRRGANYVILNEVIVDIFTVRKAVYIPCRAI